jgi:hypothetical protein
MRTAYSARAPNGGFRFFNLPHGVSGLHPGRGAIDQVGWCQEEEKRLVVYQQGGE